MNTTANIFPADAASAAKLSASLLQHIPEWGEDIARQTAAAIVDGIREQDASRSDLWADMTQVLRRHHPELGAAVAAERAWAMAWGLWQAQERAAAR